MKQSSGIEGLDEFIRDLGKLKAEARKPIMLDALENGAKIIETYAEDNIANKLNKHPTGFMVLHTGIRRVGNIVQVGVFGVIYAKIHEFGGIIKARAARALVFQVNGKWVTTKSVHMPARPYLRPAVDNHMPEIKSAIADALRALLQAAVGK